MLVGAFYIYDLSGRISGASNYEPYPYDCYLSAKSSFTVQNIEVFQLK